MSEREARWPAGVAFGRGCDDLGQGVEHNTLAGADDFFCPQGIKLFAGAIAPNVAFRFDDFYAPHPIRWFVGEYRACGLLSEAVLPAEAADDQETRP